MTSVMVVEKNQQLRASMVRQLVLKGYEVSSFSSADDALERACGGEVDIVVSGLFSIDKDGNGFLTALSERVPHVRPVVLADVQAKGAADQARRLGAVEVVSHPIVENDFLSAVERAKSAETGFHGFVHGVSLIDLLQIFHYGRRSLTLTIDSKCRLHFQGGEIIHAECGDQVGELALRAILQLPGGRIRTSAPISPTASVNRSFQSLLLDCLREVDEAGRSEFPTGEINLDAYESPQIIAPAISPSVRPSLIPGKRPGQDMIEASCRQLSERVEGCLGVAAVDLNNGEILGLHWTQPGDPKDAISRSTTNMFGSGSVGALERVLSSLSGGSAKTDTLEEIRFASPTMIHLAKRLTQRNIVVVMLAEKSSSPALCWAELRQTAHTIERLLP